MPRGGSRSPNIPVGASLSVPEGPEGGKLNRAITPGLLLFFIVGDILGGGIYALVGEVAGETGGAIWAAFLLALVMAAFTAGSYAELVSKYPRAGGAGLYAHRAFKRPFLSFLVAFAVVVSGITSASALARGFGGDYLSTFVDLPVVLTALALLGFAIAFTTALAAFLISTGDLASLADTTVALLVIVFGVVNVSVLVLRREPVEHEHFVVPSAVPVIGVCVSLALLTQIEGETYVRAAMLVGLGVALWVVNWLIVRRQGPRDGDTATTAPPST